MISMPENVMKLIDSLLYTFLWNGKKHKIKRKVVCMSYEYGGLKMVDLNALLQSFILKWILHYFSHENSKWKKIIDGFFKKVGNLQYVLNSKCTKDDMKFCLKNIKMPQYYKNMVYTWFDFKEIVECKTPIDLQCTNVRSENIWFNSNIRDHNKNVLFIKKWFDVGLLKINDVVKNSRFMSLREIEERFEKKHASLFQEYYTIVNAIPKVWKQNMLRQVHVYDATREGNEGVMKKCFNEC